MTPVLKPLSSFDIVEACAQPGCPLCRLSDAVVQRYLHAIVYEFVNDPPTREELSRSQGYCNAHAWRLPETSGGAALGVAQIYRGLLNDIGATLAQARYARRRELRQPGKRARWREGVAPVSRSLEPEQECPACAHRDQMEGIALNVMMEALARGEASMQAALKSSAGLCLVHLRRALALAPNAEAFEWLRADAGEHLARLSDELAEYIRKSDYRFVDQTFGPEGDSWLRALAAVVGARGAR